MISRNDPCWCGSGQKWKKCHFPVANISQSEQYLKQWGILIKTKEQIAGIRRAGKLAASILDQLCQAAKEGVTTNALNTLANELHKKAGAIPAPLHYGSPPFPKSICTSLNEVICHGIPNDIPLKKGDIMNIDVTCILDGYYGDCSRMVTIDPVSEEKQRVVDVSYECLMRSIAILRPGVLWKRSAAPSKLMRPNMTARSSINLSATAPASTSTKLPKCRTITTRQKSPLPRE